MPIRGEERVAAAARHPLEREAWLPSAATACTMRPTMTPPNATPSGTGPPNNDSDSYVWAIASSTQSEFSSCQPSCEFIRDDSRPRSLDTWISGSSAAHTPSTLSPCSSIWIGLGLSFENIPFATPDIDMCCFDLAPKPDEADPNLALLLARSDLALQAEQPEDDETTLISRPTTPDLDEPDVASFVSLEANASQRGELDRGKQPWRRIWPPRPGTPLHRRVSYRLDVAIFSFNRDTHLLPQNHPWQAWKDEDPPHISIELDEEDLWDDDEAMPVQDSAPGLSSTTQLEALDQFIEGLDLLSVVPDKFNYLRPLQRYETERPYRLQLPPGLVPISPTNVVTKSYNPVQVHDMVGHEDKFALDVSGFQFYECNVPVGEWDDQAITKAYLPALRDWVVSLLGGDSGLVYSFNFRHHSSDSFVPVQRPWTKGCFMGDHPGTLDLDDGEDTYSMKRFLLGDRHDGPYNNIAEVKGGLNGPCHWKRPFFRVHCDASNSTYKHRLPMLRPDDAQELMEGRVRLVSVWRTLSPHRQDTPLALCDARTVDPTDLMPMDIVYPHFADEVYEVKYSKNHRWFYNSGMTTDDVVIFKLSDTHAKDTICPHTAFIDPTVPEGTPPRTSIEVKMMIFGGEPNG